MSKHLQRDLDNLQRDLLALAGLVEEAIHKAIRALQHARRRRWPDEVIDGDAQIDEEENHVDEECLKILALHQPVAVDLRRIAAAMMINADLERMGDLAEDIAERAVHLAELPHDPDPREAAAHDRPDDDDGPPEPRRLRQPRRPPGPPRASAWTTRWTATTTRSSRS